MINELVREAWAREAGIHPPPQTIICSAHGAAMPTSYVVHCPDELSCGCRFIVGEIRRCVTCGWPVRDAALAADPPVPFCGDGRHGCLDG